MRESMLVICFGLAGLAMQAFSTSRNIDAKTICDLSMENYIEVRDRLQ